MAKRANYEGTIVKRKKNGKAFGWKGSILVGLTPDGQRDRRWVSGVTSDEVRQKLQVIKNALANNTLSSQTDHTIATFAEVWLEHKKRLIRPITLESYRLVLKTHCLPHIGRIKLDKLSPMDLDRLYAKLSDAGLSTRVIRYVHTLVYGMLKQALKWGMLARNVAEAATPPALKTAEAQVWTAKQALKFLDHARQKQDRLYALWYLTLFSGVRRAEVLGLHWRDVSLETGQVFICSTLVEVNGKLQFGEPKTRAGKRTIAITPDTVEVLKAHLEHQRLEQAKAMEGWTDSALVFTTSIGTPINPGNLARAYKAAQRSADVPDIRFHDLRHTAASMSIRRGDSAKIVADRLGHTNVAFTLNTYVHIFAEQRREGAFGINDLRSELDEKTESESDTEQPEAQDSLQKEQQESQIEEPGDEDASDPDRG
jgi:integrase